MKKIVVCLCIVIAAGYGIREFFYIGLVSNKAGIFDKFNTIFNKQNNFETLILGSSRAESHYNCSMIDSVLHTNTFNLGIEGATMSFSLDILDAYLEKSKCPSTIILNIDYNFPQCDNDTIFMFPRYFPYLKNQTLYNALNKRDYRFAGFRYFPFYSLPFMGDKFLAVAFRGYLNKPGQYDLNFKNGYSPLSPLNYVPPEQWRFEPTYACNDDKFYQRLNLFIGFCKKNRIRLCIVESPMYYKKEEQILNRVEFKRKILKIAQLNHIVLLDYSTDSLCNHKNYFADPAHMNEEGSTLFTAKLVKDIIPFFN